MKFCSLHHHSTFSFLDGYGLPEAHVRRAAELGMEAMALTEHGNVSSHVKLEKACAEVGNVKPIFGCELYTGGTGEEKKQRKNHLTVLAENQDGYRNLLRMVSKGWSDGFYYEPTVDGKMFREFSDGIIALSGCSGSLLSTSLIGGKNIAEADASFERAKRVADTFKGIIGDRYYLEVQAFPELDSTCNINKGVAELSAKLGIPLVATLDAHYTLPEESELQKILHNVRGGNRQTLEEQARAWGYDVKLTPPANDKELLRLLIGTGLTKKQAEQAISNSAEIAQRCNVVLPKLDPIRFPLPPGYEDSVTLFRKKCREGWAFRKINERGRTQEYQERVRREMALIESKEFVDYFLVVADAVCFAKDNGIPVGPARGSAAASLVCYLLRITEIDPIPFKSMVFDRFISESRLDLPDIDLDFDDEMRYLVRDYLVGKYGADKVGNIGTFTAYKGKNSLDDVARAFRIPQYEANTVKELLIERSSGDLRASATIEDTIEQFDKAREVFERRPELHFATKLEGNYRGMSTHAAGIVVANNPLTDVCAVYSREGNEVISLDKYDAEYLNILKIDVLGLKTMAMIRIILRIIGMTLDELYNLPLDDEKTIDGFRRGDVIGVFQFDGRAMRFVNSKVVPDNFLEICDINALARPGPLHSGATTLYYDAKFGRVKPKHYHPLMDEITEDTQYQVVYQEQILRIVRELGDFSWKEASNIMRIISKSRGEQEFNRQRGKFVENASKHDLTPETAHEIFNYLATAGSYAFNAAHCISYGFLAYWTMWLKVHHPLAFYVGALTKYEDKRTSLLRDLRNHGYKIYPVDVNKSTDTWGTEEDGVRPGFLQIPGIGERTAIHICFFKEEVAKGKELTWKSLNSIPGIGPKTIENIQKFALDKDPFGLDELENGIKFIRKQLKAGRIRHPDFDYSLPEITHLAGDIPEEITKVSTQVVWCGRFIRRNPKDLFQEYHDKHGENLDPKKVKDPHLRDWIVFTGEDYTDRATFFVNRWVYPKLKEKCWEIDLENDFVLVQGYRRGNQAMKMITVTDLWPISLRVVEDV